MLIMSVLWADCCSDAVPVSSNPIPRRGAAAPCLVAAVPRAACSQTHCSRHSPSRPTSGPGQLHTLQPVFGRGQGLCWRVWWWCVMCPKSVYLRSCVPACLPCAECLSGDLRPVICCSNNLALLHSGCWWPGAAPRQERSGSVPRHGRAAAPCGRQQQSSSSRAEWSHHLFTERAITHTANPEHNTFQIPNFTYYINLVRMTIGKSKRFRPQLWFNTGSKSFRHQFPRFSDQFFWQKFQDHAYRVD